MCVLPIAPEPMTPTDILLTSSSPMGCAARVYRHYRVKSTRRFKSGAWQPAITSLEPIATAYLARRERKRGIGYHLMGRARHQNSDHAGIGGSVCGAPPSRAEAYAASMICIIAS